MVSDDTKKFFHATALNVFTEFILSDEYCVHITLSTQIFNADYLV